MKRGLVIGGTLGLWASLVAGRFHLESGAREVSGGRQIVELAARRESDSFRERLRERGRQGFTWPGLRAFQVSWGWLEAVQSVHTPSAYDGDFSWLFGKLDFVLRNGTIRTTESVARLSPFFFVIGKDPAGATYLMNDLVDRLPSPRVWFWSGFHAYENLGQAPLAADFYGRAADSPEVPFTAALLARSLRRDTKKLTLEEKRNLLERESNESRR